MDTLQGTVIYGDGYARTIGFPTANLSDLTGDIPEQGLYLVNTKIKNQYYFGGLAIDEKVELFILDFNGNLYGQRLEVNIIKKIKNKVNRKDHDEDLKIGLKMIDDLKYF